MTANTKKLIEEILKLSREVDSKEISAFRGADILTDNDYEYIACAANGADKLAKALEVALNTLDQCEFIDVTDGCEECSTIWTKEYGLKKVRDAKEEIESIISGEAT